MVVSHTEVQIGITAPDRRCPTGEPVENTPTESVRTVTFETPRSEAFVVNARARWNDGI